MRSGRGNRGSAGGRGGERTGRERPARGTSRRDDRRATGRDDRRDTRRSDRGGEGRRENRRAELPPREERAAPERTRREPAGGGRYTYGVNPVLEALRAHPDKIDALFLAEGDVSRGASAEIYSRARDAGIRVTKVPRERLANMAEGGVHQGVVAELREFNYADVVDLLAAAKQSGRPALIVVLDGIQDPHNLGAIIRSAHALGAHGLVIPKDRAAAVTGAVSKTSAGAVEHTLIARVTNLSRALEELKQAGVWIAAADPTGDKDLWGARLDGPMAIVVGAEGAGVRRGVLEHCDLRVKIPLAGEVASLNASVAAGMFLYEVARQRAVTAKPVGKKAAD